MRRRHREPCCRRFRPCRYSALPPSQRVDVRCGRSRMRGRACAARAPRAQSSSVDVGRQVGEAQQRRARLARAQELARAADLQVAARDLEAVARLGHRLQPRLARCRRQRRACTAARRPLATAPRPTRPRSWCSCDRPKRSACSITISAGIRHVDADLDHRGATPARAIWPPVNSDITAAFSAAGMRAVQQADHARRAAPRSAAACVAVALLQVERLALLDQRADPVDLPALRRPRRGCASITSSRGCRRTAW